MTTTSSASDYLETQPQALVQSTSKKTPKVTLVIGPRERFSYTQDCLESIYSNTHYPFDLVFVDVCSPKPVERYLRKKAEEESFKVIRTARYISPNQARNLGLRYVLDRTILDCADSEYVVFVENDVIVKPGWLTQLVACAEETNAAVVGPLTCIGHPAHQVIHNAGGRSYIKTSTTNGKIKRKIKQSAYLTGKAVADVPDELCRVQCDYVEFHCALVRTSIFSTAPFKATNGLLDEGMMATREHIDFCFMVTEAGGTIYSDRTAVITTDTVGIAANKTGLMEWFGESQLPDFKLYDLPYFMLRWSDAWDLASLHHLRQKWNLAEDKYFKKRYAGLGGRRRELLVYPLVNWLTFGRGSDRLEKWISGWEHKLNHFLYSRYIQNHPDAPQPIEQSVVQKTLQTVQSAH
ncbi:MAG: putative glycosyltransferase [Phormidesmis priestleyi Ana]|uniref:Putative glycosyltransferase n=1 Tax=Phormidesmis priestleyi Ana TaxID=1666911 RepID=A0A0P7ZNG4_9CYAN|nr:MAG: putative glycosyltransferase [Phormidesmis priestleyi Ana]